MGQEINTHEETGKIAFWRSIQGRMILFFIMVGAIPALVIGILTYSTASNAMTEEAYSKLQMVHELKKVQIDSYFEERYADVEVLASSPFVVEALANLDHAFMENGDKIGSAAYNEAEAKYGPWLVEYKQAYGYYDLLLCCPEGSIVYTVEKESDLGEFVAGDGSLAGSVLAHCHAGVLEADGAFLADFEAYAPSGGAPCAFIGAPIEKDGEVLGVVILQMPLGAINAIMQERSGFGETQEVYLVGHDKLMRSDSYLDPTGHSVEASFAGTVADNGVDTEAVSRAIAGEEGEDIIIDYNGNPVLSAYGPAGISGLDWVILAEIDEAEAMAEPNSLLQMFLMVLGISIVAIVFIGFVIARMISKPMNALVPVAAAVAKGDLSLSVEAKGKDETGMVARGFASVISYMQEMAAAAGKLADGDLNAEVTTKGEKDSLGNAFSKMIVNLRQLIGQVGDSANSLSDASGQLSTAADQAGSATSQIATVSQQVAKGSEDQTKGVSEVKTALDQLSKAIDTVNNGSDEQSKAVEQATTIVQQVSSATEQVAKNAQEAASGAQQTSEVAKAAGETVEKTVEGMSKINVAVKGVAEKIGQLGQHSDEIGKMIAVIDDIAAQTNLLALNAAIEAARAGEQGRGFAVVADEVKKLAERTATETQSISNVVGSVQKGVGECIKAAEDGSAKTEEGAKLANEAGTALHQILESVQSVTAQIEQISAAAEELSGSSSEMVQVVDRVGKVAEQNSAASQQMAASKTQLSDSTNNVAGVSEENSAATEEMSASAEEMSAQVQEVVASSQSLAGMADELKNAVAFFKLNGNGGGHGKEAMEAKLKATAKAPVKAAAEAAEDKAAM